MAANIFGPHGNAYIQSFKDEQARLDAMTPNQRREALRPLNSAAEKAKRAAKEQLKKNEEKKKIIPALEPFEKSRHSDFKYIEDYKEGNHNWEFFVDPRRAEYAHQKVTLSDLIGSFKDNATIKMDKKSGWLTSSNKIIITRKDNGLKLAFKNIRDDRKLEELYKALMTIGFTAETPTSGGYKSRRRNRHKTRTATRRARATKSR